MHQIYHVLIAVRQLYRVNGSAGLVARGYKETVDG